MTKQPLTAIIIFKTRWGQNGQTTITPKISFKLKLENSKLCWEGSFKQKTKASIQSFIHSNNIFNLNAQRSQKQKKSNDWEWISAFVLIVEIRESLIFLSKMIKWSNQLRAAFGASFLWLICLIYFTQVFIHFFPPISFWIMMISRGFK